MKDSIYWREWRKQHPGYDKRKRGYCVKWYRNKQFRKYGVIYPDPTLCFICGRYISGSQIMLDHNHETGKFRAFLCKLCNTRVGWYEKYKERLLQL